MRATNLSVCVPNKGCDKVGGCENYCVSKMTGYCPNSDIKLMRPKVDKVKHFAELANVTSVLITGKGEPMMNVPDTMELISCFRRFPIELQTNGIKLREDPEIIDALARAGLDVLAISADTLDVMISSGIFVRAQKGCGLVTRVTLNVTKLIPVKTTLEELIEICKTGSIDQLSIRQILAPNYVAGTPQSKWIERNVNHDQYIALANQVVFHPRAHMIRDLPYGAAVYDIDGIAVTYFDYCVQDSSNEDDIRSIIFQEDGHLYTAWNSKASILF